MQIPSLQFLTSLGIIFIAIERYEDLDDPLMALDQIEYNVQIVLIEKMNTY